MKTRLEKMIQTRILKRNELAFKLHIEAGEKDDLVGEINTLEEEIGHIQYVIFMDDLDVLTTVRGSLSGLYGDRSQPTLTPQNEPYKVPPFTPPATMPWQQPEVIYCKEES